MNPSKNQLTRDIKTLSRELTDRETAKAKGWTTYLGDPIDLHINVMRVELKMMVKQRLELDTKTKTLSLSQRKYYRSFSEVYAAIDQQLKHFYEDDHEEERIILPNPVLVRNRLCSFLPVLVIFIHPEALQLIIAFGVIMLGLIVYGVLKSKQIIKRTKTRLRNNRKKLYLLPTLMFVAASVQAQPGDPSDYAPLQELIFLVLVGLAFGLFAIIYQNERHYSKIKKMTTKFSKFIGINFRKITVITVLIVALLIFLSGSLTSCSKKQDPTPQATTALQKEQLLLNGNWSGTNYGYIATVVITDNRITITTSYGGTVFYDYDLEYIGTAYQLVISSSYHLDILSQTDKTLHLKDNAQMSSFDLVLAK